MPSILAGKVRVAKVFIPVVLAKLPLMDWLIVLVQVKVLAPVRWKFVNTPSTSAPEDGVR